MTNSADLILPAAQRASGSVVLPGSKSISNRVLLLAALAQGTTSLSGLLDSDDTRVMLAALRQLGLPISGTIQDTLHIGGAAQWPQAQAEIFLGNAGTAFRPLTAVLAMMGGAYRLHGVARMHERPIGDLVDALRLLGCQIGYEQNHGYPPLQIAPGALDLSQPVRVRAAVSSQFLTALLLAAPLAVARSGQEMVIELDGPLISRPYISITLDLMRRFGVQVRQEGWERFVVPAGASYASPGEFRCEGDASSASYFLGLGAIAGGPIRIEGVGANSIQGDLAFADFIESIGATVQRAADSLVVSGPVVARGERLRAFDRDFNLIPDAAMTAAVLALYADGPCHLRNIASWRVKETDRIAAMHAELAKLGARVESGPDSLSVWPLAPAQWQSARIHTYDDHRMAMCFSLASFGGQALTIADPGCVSKTYPEYFRDFQALILPPSSAPVICIDGPTASGKGTIAAALAQALGWHTLDSGALYRLTAWSLLQAGEAEAAALHAARHARELDARFEGSKVYLRGQDVSLDIRQEQVGNLASRIAAMPAVRAALLLRQRQFQQSPGLVADGRDMGSVVFPDAALKIYLDADVQVRAARRCEQLLQKGINAKLPDLLSDLMARDARDKSRQHAPLIAAPDAITLDSSQLNVAEVVQKVLDLWFSQAL